MNYQETWGKKSSSPKYRENKFHQFLYFFFFEISDKKTIKLLGLREDPCSSE